MQRYDLRHLKADFYDRMLEVMENEAKSDEVIIFMFEVGDFSPIQKSADLIKENNYTLMNSLKYNEVDWTIVVKKTAPESSTTETVEENSESEAV
jgi:NADH-quinone oxidoreductase subunit E